MSRYSRSMVFFFFQAEDGIRDVAVTGVQTCALPILAEAQILVDEGLRGPRRPAPLHQLLERAAPVEARACTMAVPALADPVGFLGRQIGRASCRERV